MIPAAAFATLLLLGAPAKAELHPGLSLGLAYAQEGGSGRCDAIGLDCTSAYARGPALGLSGQLLYGPFSGWVQVGGRVQSFWTMGSDTALAIAALAVLRLGGTLFLDLAGGAGYGWARRDGLIVASEQVQGGEFGPALGLRLGWFFAEHWALALQGDTIASVPGYLSIGAGLEWRL